MSSFIEDGPLADELKNAVQSQALERGWTQDEDDASLAEYIVLMVANNKSEDEIVSELSNELLQGASGVEDFASWLMAYIKKLTGSGDSDSSAQQQMTQEEAPIPAAYSNDLDETAPDNAYVHALSAHEAKLIDYRPKGPKGLHGGPRGGRGGRNSVQGRGGFDSALHRTRGNDRINSHTRGAPKGPKQMQGKDVRPGMQKALNGLQNQQMPNPMMAGAQGQFNPISPQQQMEFMAMMEQQARMLAQFMPNMVPPGMNGGPPQPTGQNGRSMFDRVERGRGGMNIRGRGRGGQVQNGSRKPSETTEGGDAQTQTSGDTPMDTESAVTSNSKDPASTICYFNLRCLNKECQYAHQSPAAPVGTEIDMSQTCSFGAACKNNQCHGKHPSPALIAAHKAEQECKFWPNCTNPNCPFKHPTMPLCQFGASCTNKDCKWTHLKTKCKFNPCTNARCPFAHDQGQNRNMSAFSWTKDQGDQQQNEDTEGTHNRKFVVEGEEEFIKPEQEMETAADSGQQQEVAT